MPVGDAVGVAHRLDRDTSGVCVLAKTKAALRALSIQFQERRVNKTYVGAVAGVPDDAGVIEGAIGKVMTAAGHHRVQSTAMVYAFTSGRTFLEQDVANFLLVRGRYAWLGQGWKGCGSAPAFPAAAAGVRIGRRHAVTGAEHRRVLLSCERQTLDVVDEHDGVCTLHRGGLLKHVAKLGERLSGRSARESGGVR